MGAKYAQIKAMIGQSLIGKGFSEPSILSPTKRLIKGFIVKLIRKSCVEISHFPVLGSAEVNNNAHSSIFAITRRGIHPCHTVMV